ncbi:hypothetical protein NC651_014708 [Populus alba x Populus x berolinensis]|nr:hypothetical protein NC651_014708 [Populus alba x Populus x berolinensis]
MSLLSSPLTSSPSTIKQLSHSFDLLLSAVYISIPFTTEIPLLSLFKYKTSCSFQVPKSAFLFPIDDAHKKKTSSHVSSSSLEAVNKLISNSIKNKNLTLDEMRVVPTGPYPLHNK